MLTHTYAHASAATELPPAGTGALVRAAHLARSRAGGPRGARRLSCTRRRSPCACRPATGRASSPRLPPRSCRVGASQLGRAAARAHAQGAGQPDGCCAPGVYFHLTPSRPAVRLQPRPAPAPGRGQRAESRGRGRMREAGQGWRGENEQRTSRPTERNTANGDGCCQAVSEAHGDYVVGRPAGSTESDKTAGKP